MSNIVEFSEIYSDKNVAFARYSAIEREFRTLFPQSGEINFISAPGRTEIGGNHTDHQRGCVLAAAVDSDAVCACAVSHGETINIVSKGYEPVRIALNDLNPRDNEIGTTAALVRGIADKLFTDGYKIGGFDAFISSDVNAGSGLSSSAAFEVAVANAFNHLFNDGKISAQIIAQVGQYAENVHFGKPSGLMDQMASSVGALTKMDFLEPKSPVIEPIALDLHKLGYSVCIVDTKGSHADLTDEYAAITDEMGEIARFFGKECLVQVQEDEFLSKLSVIRNCKISDRAILRAMHFFADNTRVNKQCFALEKGDFTEFLRLVNKSGDSSFQFLQNVYSVKKPHIQDLSLALALSKRILNGAGACRVHGGGFAGTVQAFVPDSLLDEYSREMNKVFGNGACNIMNIRNIGGTRVYV
jgi:galactokinase